MVVSMTPSTWSIPDRERIAAPLTPIHLPRAPPASDVRFGHHFGRLVHPRYQRRDCGVLEVGAYELGRLRRRDGGDGIIVKSVHDKHSGFNAQTIRQTCTLRDSECATAWEKRAIMPLNKTRGPGQAAYVLDADCPARGRGKAVLPGDRRRGCAAARCHQFPCGVRPAKSVEHKGRYGNLRTVQW